MYHWKNLKDINVLRAKNMEMAGCLACSSPSQLIEVFLMDIESQDKEQILKLI